jgi:archaellum component FlaC
MINNLKEETEKLVFHLKENVNKQLNEFKKKYKHMNEIKKTIQDMKEEINKDMETLKTIQHKQLNIPNKYHNQKLGEQNGIS